jgi:hypothetical protein
MGSAKKAYGFSVRRGIACAEAKSKAEYIPCLVPKAKSKAAYIPALPEAKSKAAGEGARPTRLGKSLPS